MVAVNHLFDNKNSRRTFLRYLAASPLASISPGFSHDVNEEGEVILNAEDALDVFDFKATAKKILPPAHYGYLSTGTFDDKTLHKNREAFDHYYLRSRRLVNISNVDTSVEILGEKWNSPIILAPCGSQRAYHPDGELAVASAANRMNHLQILSTVSSTSVEDVSNARRAPVWYQLYTSGGWEGVKSMLRRAENSGSPALVLTVDLPAGGIMRNTLERYKRLDKRNCDVCHANSGIAAGPKPMLQQIPSNFIDEGRMPLDWKFVDRLRKETTMKILIKGIVTAEDAELCVSEGLDGIIVSNHGGRADNSGRGAIDSLAEVASVVKGKTLLLMDSGIRRGMDIFKALALGADAVCIGRPYLWGLGAFGQSGVEKVLELLQNELEATMQFSGVNSAQEITHKTIGKI